MSREKLGACGGGQGRGGVESRDGQGEDEYNWNQRNTEINRNEQDRVGAKGLT